MHGKILVLFTSPKFNFPFLPSGHVLLLLVNLPFKILYFFTDRGGLNLGTVTF